jgi:precorrin-6B methylase 2
MPRSVRDLQTDSRPGFASVTETADGILQFVPDEPVGSASPACYGEFLRGQLELLESMLRPGMFVVEADAGVGAHALFLSKCAGPEGHLFLIESNAIRRQILRQNILANRVENATLLRGPVADSTEDSDGTPPRWMSIDDLQLERLDWIKIQTERTAKAILDGARETLWRLRPKIFVGVRDHASAVAMANILREFGYRCWCVEMPLFNSANFARYERDIFNGLTATGLFALPEELDNEFALASGVEIT